MLFKHLLIYLYTIYFVSGKGHSRKSSAKYSGHISAEYSISKSTKHSRSKSTNHSRSKSTKHSRSKSTKYSRSTSTKHLRVSSKYSQSSNEAHSPAPTTLPGLIPSDDPGAPISGNPIIPSGTGLGLDPSAGGTIDPRTGRPFDPATGSLIDPTTGSLIDPTTGSPIDPTTGSPIDPTTGSPIDPTTGSPIDPGTGRPIDPTTGSPIDQATGRPIDPTTGGPIDPANGNPEPPTNPSSGGSSIASELSKQDIIILSVFGGLFLLILLSLLLGYCINKKREADEDKPSNTYETANIGSSETNPNQREAGGMTSHLFFPFSSGHETSERAQAQDIEAANISADETSQKTLSEKINEWFMSTAPGSKSLSNSKVQSDEDALLNNNATGKDIIMPVPFFLKGKNKVSDESLHGAEIIRQASITASSEIETPIEFSQDDIVFQNPENENIVMDANGKELFVLPPMVRHTTVDGKRVENHVEAKDVLMGSVASREKTALKTPKDTNQNVVETVVVDDTESNSTNNELVLNNKALIRKTTEELGMADTVLNSNLTNIPVAAVFTETTTIINQKPLKSAMKQEEEEENDDFTIWAPPAPTSHVVFRTYTPSESDELTVAVGDLIGVEKTYNDGWAKVQNITQHRKRGMLPLAIITPLKSGPTQTVIKSAGGIWKTGASTSVKGPDSEVINYREMSLNYRTDSSRVPSLKKHVSFMTDITMISDDE